MNGDAATNFAALADAWVGAHALAIFLAVLLLALAGTVLVGRRSRKGAPPSRRRRLIEMLVVAGFAGSLFVVLAGQLDPGSVLSRFDRAVSGAVLQQVPATVVDCFAALTHAGDGVTLTALALLVGMALLLARQPVLALGFVGGLAGNGLLTAALKDFYGRARPLQPPDGLTVHSYSFPSGHSSGSIVACGLLAYLAMRLLPPRWHLPALCAAVVLTLSVGASRVFIRAHFPSDVLAGFASGTVSLVCCLMLLEAARSWRSRG